jgi:hypothetical protein
LLLRKQTHDDGELTKDRNWPLAAEGAAAPSGPSGGTPLPDGSATSTLITPHLVTTLRASEASNSTVNPNGDREEDNESRYFAKQPVCHCGDRAGKEDPSELKANVTDDRAE